MPFTIELVSAIKQQMPDQKIIISGNNSVFLTKDTKRLFGDKATVCAEKEFDKVIQKCFGKVFKLKEIDDLALLDFSYFDDLRGRFYLLMKFGCNFRCKFCSECMFWPEKRQFSVNHMIRQVRLLKEKYDIKEINFWDDTITADWAFGREFCEKMISERLNLEWLMYSRIDTINEDKLRLMHKAGLRYIFFGVESLDEKSLKFYNKTNNLNRYLGSVKSTLILCEKYDIRPIVSFILGCPVQTKQDIEKEFKEMINLKKKFKDLSLELSQLTPEINSILWQEYEKGKIKLWKIQYPALQGKFAGKQLFSWKYENMPSLVPQNFIYENMTMTQREFEEILCKIWDEYEKLKLYLVR